MRERCERLPVHCRFEIDKIEIASRKKYSCRIKYEKIRRLEGEKGEQDIMRRNTHRLLNDRHVLHIPRAPRCPSRPTPRGTRQSARAANTECRAQTGRAAPARTPARTRTTQRTTIRMVVSTMKMTMRMTMWMAMRRSSHRCDRRRSPRRPTRLVAAQRPPCSRRHSPVRPASESARAAQWSDESTGSESNIKVMIEMTAFSNCFLKQRMVNELSLKLGSGGRCVGCENE
jgi:hypothetical protein